MDQVNIFDVASAPDSQSDDDGWYTQTITGEAPAPRVDFCLVVAPAPDNSSFNIHMYGGRHFLGFFLSFSPHLLVSSMRVTREF